MKHKHLIISCSIFQTPIVVMHEACVGEKLLLSLPNVY